MWRDLVAHHLEKIDFPKARIFLKKPQNAI